MTTRSALRVAHFSDLHYGPRNLAEADRCFGAAIEIHCGTRTARPCSSMWLTSISRLDR
jgi:hypothetical protein